jgi:SAM-dependent methyltransferase
MPAPLDEPRRINLVAWEECVPIHAASKMYDLDGFVAGRRQLSAAVRYDAPRLGDLHGIEAVHLQCHIGTDTLSLARLGATVTGLDFSPGALATARDLARRCGIDAQFVEAELYDAPNVLPNAAFDLVYTGIGALCWLPDIARWAQVVAKLLRPGGRLFIREGHPVLWALEDRRDDGGLALRYPYFETVQPQRFESETTYTDGPPLGNRVTYEWNHGIGELITAVLDAGLVLDAFVEHRECDWQALPQMVETEWGRWALPPEQANRVPCTYTLQAYLPE